MEFWSKKLKIEFVEDLSTVLYPIKRYAFSTRVPESRRRLFYTKVLGYQETTSTILNRAIYVKIVTQYKALVLPFADVQFTAFIRIDRNRYVIPDKRLRRENLGLRDDGLLWFDLVVPLDDVVVSPEMTLKTSRIKFVTAMRIE